jgi:hypothetical protein
MVDVSGRLIKESDAPRPLTITARVPGKSVIPYGIRHTFYVWREMGRKAKPVLWLGLFALGSWHFAPALAMMTGLERPLMQTPAPNPAPNNQPSPGYYASPAPASVGPPMNILPQYSAAPVSTGSAVVVVPHPVVSIYSPPRPMPPHPGFMRPQGYYPRPAMGYPRPYVTGRPMAFGRPAYAAGAGGGRRR